MNRNPLLSVIVANYNNESYIRDCLDSILGQTYKDIEIIISDDASTDNSPGIIRQYEVKYPGIVKAIFSTVNRGVAQNRHDAILQARGDYITTLDSDDYYYDIQKLEKEMDVINHYKEKGKDILAFSNIVIVKEDKRPLEVLGNPGNIKEGKIFEHILCRSCMIPRDFMMKKDAYFHVGGYDLSLRTHEDWDFKIKMSKTYEFHYTHHHGTAYRRHSKGLSSLPYLHRTRNLWKVFTSNYRWVRGGSEKTIKKEFFLFMKTRDIQYLQAIKKARGSGSSVLKLFFHLPYALVLHINRVLWETQVGILRYLAH